MVACDWRGEFIGSVAFFPCRVLSPLLAEASSLHWAMALVLEFGFRLVYFETDYLHLFECWRKKFEGFSYLASIVSDCHNIALPFYYVCLSFIRCSGNMVIDFLVRNASTHASSTWVEEVPPVAIHLVNVNVLASMPPCY